MRRKKRFVLIFILSTILLAAVMPVPAIASDWSQFQHDEVNSGYTSDYAPINGTGLAWSYYTGTSSISGIDTTPIVADGKVFVLNYQGYLYAFVAKTGELFWITFCNSEHGAFELSTPAYHDGVVYVATSEGSAGHNRVTAVYADNGTIREQIDLDSGFELTTPVTYADGKIYVGSWKGGISGYGTYYCLDASDVTNVIWNRTAPYVTGYYWAGAAIIGPYIVYGDDRSNVTCLDKDTGVPRGHVNVSQAFGITPVEEIRSSIVWNENTGRIYFTGKKENDYGHVYAVGFNPNDGAFNAAAGWCTDIGYSTSTPVVYDGRVYVGQGPLGSYGKVYCLAESDGSEIWSTPNLGGVQSSPVISVVDNRKFIYFTTNKYDGAAYCLEDLGSTYTTRWICNPPDDYQYILQGVAISDGMIYFGTDAGYVYGFKEGAYEPDDGEEGVGPTKMEDMYIKYDQQITGENIYKVEVTNIYRTLYDTNKVRFTGHINFTWGPGLGMECEDIVLRSCLVVDNGLDNGYGTNFELTVNGGDPDYSGISCGYSEVGPLIRDYSGMSVEEAFMETGILGNMHYGGGRALLHWNNIELLTNLEKDFDFTIEAQDVTGIRMFGGLKITTGHYESIAMASAIQNVQPTVYANAPSSYLMIIMDAFIGLLQTIAGNEAQVGSNIAFWIPYSEASDPDAEDGYWDQIVNGSTTNISGFTLHITNPVAGTCNVTSDGNNLTFYAPECGYPSGDISGIYYESDLLDARNGTVIEARMKCHDSIGDGVGRAVGGFGLDDENGNMILEVTFGSDGYGVCWRYKEKSGTWIISGTHLGSSEFHTYRAHLGTVGSPNFEMYVDGNKIFTANGVKTSDKNRIWFGLPNDDYYGWGRYLDMDFISYHKDYPFTPTDPTPDNTPPTVSMTSPENNQTISGVHTCTVNASDSGGSGLTEVEYYVDGRLAGTNYSSPFSWVWNTSKWSAGLHTLKTKAYDGDGNWNWSQNVTVDVKAFPEVPAITPLVFILVLISLFVFGAITIRKMFK